MVSVDLSYSRKKCPWLFFSHVESQIQFCFFLLIASENGNGRETILYASSSTIVVCRFFLATAFFLKKKRSWYVNVKIVYRTRSGNGKERILVCCCGIHSLCNNNSLWQGLEASLEVCGREKQKNRRKSFLLI